MCFVWTQKDAQKFKKSVVVEKNICKKKIFNLKLKYDKL